MRISSGRAAASRAILTSLMLAAAACSPSPPGDEASYRREIETFRAAKDAAFGQEGSPIPARDRPRFLPLAYFPVSSGYRVPAILRTASDRPTTEMPTSTGQRRLMRLVGVLEFSVNGQSQSMGAFVEAAARDLNRLFVPFTDLTSGAETYPAGRYLDLDRTATGIYVIDFNHAYHPYCYYNAEYDCPYPPRQNRLSIPIRAGEKMKEGVAPARLPEAPKGEEG